VKSRITLIVILVVLALIYLYVERERSSVVEIDRPFVEVDTTLVTRLDISSADNEIALIKEGDGWVVGGESPYPANERTVTSALNRFEQMNRKALISEREEKFTDFEVDDSAGVRLTIHQGGEPIMLILGKAGPTYQTSYARLEGSSEIWEIGGNHKATFDRKPADWRDKTINSLDMEEFTRFDLRYPDLSFSLEKRDTVWHVSSPKEEFDVEGNLADRLLRMMSRMNTVEFVDTLAEDAFDPPLFQIVAELQSGDPIDIKLIKKDDQQYFLRKAGARSDFVIYNSTAEALMKKPDDFKPKPKDE